VITARSAPAKVNLWLRVGTRREDGFHDIDTLFCALDLADTVTIGAAPYDSGIRLRSSFAPPLRALPDLGPPADNLAVRAAAAFLEGARLPADLDIDLVKRIPAGGGLGGGSTDAAAVLRALHDLHPTVNSADGIHEIAAGLGSDVPFFASGHALARGAGRGERLEPLRPLPGRPVLLVLPQLDVSTAAAYRWLDDDREHGAEAAADRLAEPLPPAVDWDQVAVRARNDFEPVVFRRHPELARYRDLLVHLGARPALLAGSGSTLFGVFHDQAMARTAAREIPSRYPAVATVLTRTRAETRSR
jgi:4-diphosphocytidyl-2-C-methyl-D-erythritol kinase